MHMIAEYSKEGECIKVTPVEVVEFTNPLDGFKGEEEGVRASWLFRHKKYGMQVFEKRYK